MAVNSETVVSDLVTALAAIVAEPGTTPTSGRLLCVADGAADFRKKTGIDLGALRSFVYGAPHDGAANHPSGPFDLTQKHNTSTTASAHVVVMRVGAHYYVVGRVS